MSKAQRARNKVLASSSLRDTSSHLSRNRDGGGMKKSKKKVNGRGKKKAKKKSSKRRRKIPFDRLMALTYGKRSSSVKQPTPVGKIKQIDEPFVPNKCFAEAKSATHLVGILDECIDSKVYASSASEEVHLCIGLDVGTSCTKVIIGDVDNDRFEAIPFRELGEDRYLLPTQIFHSDNGMYSLQSSEGAVKNTDLKLKIMRPNPAEKDCVSIIAYVSLVIRHVMNWYYSKYKGALANCDLFWTVNVGLPADKVSERRLSSVYQSVVVTAAQGAISKSKDINYRNLREIYREVVEDRKYVSKKNQSKFQFVGNDDGMVGTVPEIAAQMYGVKKSNRWSKSRPIAFLVDVGAATVDSSVFSIVPDKKGEDYDQAFNMFTADVSTSGVRVLHKMRIEWLIKILPESFKGRKEVNRYLHRIDSISTWNIRIPGSIYSYLNNLSIPKGNRTPDDKMMSFLSDSVFLKVLRKAKYENSADKTFGKLRTIISGGGSQSDLYRQFLEGLSTTTIKLDIETLQKPDNLKADGVNGENYHRLSVAYGLAHYENWRFNWPRDIKPVPQQKSRKKPLRISKDDM